MLKFTPKRRLTGGLRLPARKSGSTAHAIRKGPIPSRLVLSTRQHYGAAAEPVVEIGQAVSRGQRLARAGALEGADVHAPTSGRVAAIEAHTTPLYSAVTRDTCIVIEPDGEDRGEEASAPIDSTMPADRLASMLSSAGIVGLGGAVYPTAAKLIVDRSCRLLIINGAECEPYISCDDMLMRESAAEIVGGAEILRAAAGAPECIVAIERDKPEAIEAIGGAIDALGATKLEIAELPSIYPAGGERQLIEVLAGFEIPSGRYPTEFGYLCQNVGTAYAVYRYIHFGEVLTRRIVTITGSAVAEPCNVEALLGTPIRELIELCGGYRCEPVRLIHGGSMMGYALPSDSLPVTKATNCIVAATADEVEPVTQPWPCIRCGECEIVCPARLQPQELLIAAERNDSSALESLALADCIDCGCCDIVCPSHIPLTEIFRQAKPRLAERIRLRTLSAESDQRYRARERRLRNRSIAERERLDSLRREIEDDASRAATIEAAVQRAREKKRGRSDDGS